MTINTSTVTILRSFGELHEVQHSNGKRSLVRGLINQEGKQLPGLDHGPYARFSRCGWCVCTAKQAKSTMISLANKEWHPVREWDTRRAGVIVRILVGRVSSDGFNQGYGSGPSSWKEERDLSEALNPAPTRR